MEKGKEELVIAECSFEQFTLLKGLIFFLLCRYNGLNTFLLAWIELTD
jgi:hypothetical protein